MPSFVRPIHPKISIEGKGILSGSDVAAVLQSSQFGFLAYVEHLFGKSGIFAAYAGNGMIIINFPSDSKMPRDGLIKGVHYMNAFDIEIDKTEVETAGFSENIFDWYQSRNAATHAKIIYDTLVKEM